MQKRIKQRIYSLIRATTQYPRYAHILLQSLVASLLFLNCIASAGPINHDLDSEVTGLLALAREQQRVGEYSDAQITLNKAQTSLASSRQTQLKALVGSEQGNVLVALGDYEPAEQSFNTALASARSLSNKKIAAAILNNLGNLHTIRNKPDAALSAYAESARLARSQKDYLQEARALANGARAMLATGDRHRAMGLAAKAVDLLAHIETSHQRPALLINLAQTYLRINEAGSSIIYQRANYLLQQARTYAATYDDPGTLSFVHGYLGATYARQNRIAEAALETRRALFHAQVSGGTQSAYPLYLWNVQLARLLSSQGKEINAIDAYKHALNNLKKLRYSLHTGYGPDENLSGEAINSVYLEYLDLLLSETRKQHSQEKTRQMLNEARNTVEQMKASELRDYFKDDCVDRLEAKTKDISEVSSSALIIYPIGLKDRTELLLHLPDGNIKARTIEPSVKQLAEIAQKLRILLEDSPTHFFLEPSQQLYDWLIRPIEADMQDLKIDTLVFVPDGALRSIPMAALYDGNQFLIEKYAIAITPGIDLTDPRRLDRKQIKPLYAGLTESVQGFPGLPNVEEELTAAHQTFNGELRIDKDFVSARLAEDLENQQFNIVHFATHGHFGNNVEDSYLLTYDERLSISDLAEYIGLFKFREKPLDLLILSACETAQGDQRAALGLSGVAIKAGARSTVGTLWQVRDLQSSQLMQNFYHHLKDPALSRAEALRQAQLSMIDSHLNNPHYWSGYILINSWL